MLGTIRAETEGNVSITPLKNNKIYINMYKELPSQERWSTLLIPTLALTTRTLKAET